MQREHWGRRGWRSCALLALGVATACPRALPAKTHDPAPAFSIPVMEMGYRPPGQLYLLTRSFTSSLMFLDAKHLLFTFKESKLMRRDEHDDDQLIRAVVLELPSGREQASKEWRMHDRRQYLWRLGGGKVVVRQGDELFVTDAGLELYPLLRSATTLRSVDVSPDGRMLVTQTDLERHTPEEHQRLLEKAHMEGNDAPNEDVQVRVIRLDERAIKLTARASSAGKLVVNGSGFFSANETKPNTWTVRLHPFEQPQRESGTVVDQVASACPPDLTQIDDATVLILRCSPRTPNREGEAVSLAGKKLWTGEWRSNFVLPTLSTAENGSDFAITWVTASRPMAMDEPLNDEEVQGQVVDVLDTKTGNLRLSVPVQPVVSAGGNYALSPDGSRLAVLHRGAIEVFDVPPLSVSAPPPAAPK